MSGPWSKGEREKRRLLVKLAAKSPNSQIRLKRRKSPEISKDLVN
jgi:hypothetical protein